MTDSGFSLRRGFAVGGLLVGLAVSLWTSTRSADAFVESAHARPVAVFSQPVSAAADTTVPAYDLRAIEHAIHEGINAERTQRGRSSLAYADSLHRLGLVHSRDMAERGFFGHNNPGGEGVNDRAAALGLSCVRQLDDQTTARGFGENLYRGTLFNRYRDVFQDGERIRREFDWKTESEVASDVVQGWMDSRGHRTNILEKRYATEAIALHADGTDFFVTQIFC
jgi:uncharacterized protein YkwD